LTNRVTKAALLAIACLALPACTPAAPPTQAPAKVAAAKPFVAADGARQIVTPMAKGDPIGVALGVVQVNDLPNLSEAWAVRMFGVAGGDPAANGLRTYLGFVSPHDDAGFLLGDFRAYRILASAPGRIDLEIDEDVMGDTGELSLRTRRVIVSWTEKPQPDSPDKEFPATVTLTPAT
jgi:hypothetical protein